MPASLVPSPAVENALALAAQQTGVPVELLRAVARAESGYNPRPADSTAGAKGLMQLMPFNLAPHNVSDPYDPVQSARAAGELLAGWYRDFGAWDKAIAAYVWGPGKVRRSQDPYQWPDKVKRYVGKVLTWSGYSPPLWGRVDGAKEYWWALLIPAIGIPILWRLLK